MSVKPVGVGSSPGASGALVVGSSGSAGGSSDTTVAYGPVGPPMRSAVGPSVASVVAAVGTGPGPVVVDAGATVPTRTDVAVAVGADEGGTSAANDGAEPSAPDTTTAPSSPEQPATRPTSSAAAIAATTASTVPSRPLVGEADGTSAATSRFPGPDHRHPAGSRGPTAAGAAPRGRGRGCRAMVDQRPARPDVAIDLTSPEFLDHRLERYAELRGRCPVAWDTLEDGFWLVTGYEEVLAVARDTDTFMHKYELGAADGVDYHGIIGVPRQEGVPRQGVSEIDGADHQELRRVLNPVFSPPAVARLRPQMERVTTWFLDQVDRAGRARPRERLRHARSRPSSRCR